MENFKDYYSILNIPPNADEQLIREAYIKLSSFMHPDKQPPERRSWAEEKQKELNEAYEVLKDPIKRKEYDEYYKSYQESYNIFKDKEKENTQNNTSKNNTETSPTYNQNTKDKPFGCIGEIFTWLILIFLISMTIKIIKSCSENTSLKPTNSSNSSIYNTTNTSKTTKTTSGVTYPTSNNSNASNYNIGDYLDTTVCFDYLNSQNYQDALQAGQNAVQEYPKSARAHICLGQAYSNLSDFKLSIKELKIAEKLANNKSDLLAIYSYMGLNYERLGDSNNALLYYDKQLKMARDLNNKEEESKALNNIAGIYNNQGNYNKAIDYYNKSLQLTSKPSTIATIYTNIASVYSAKGHNNKAVEYYKKAIEFNQKAGDDHKLAMIMISLGYIYTDLKNFQEAQNYLQKGLLMIQKFDDKYWEAYAYLGFGRLHLAQNQENLAKEYFTKAYNLFKAIGNNNKAQGVYEKYLK